MNFKYNKYILIRLSIFLLFNLNLSSQSILKAKVVGVKDGDTVVVIDSLNNQTILRLAEIDCPEKGQPFGMKAKQFTSDQVYLKNVEYKVIDTDRYGRSMAMIYYDDDKKYLSKELIKAGLAWHFKRYSNSKELAELEDLARKNKIGLWVDENPISPSDWRFKN